jgi:hypothetical protein
MARFFTIAFYVAALILSISTAGLIVENMYGDYGMLFAALTGVTFLLASNWALFYIFIFMWQIAENLDA